VASWTPADARRAVARARWNESFQGDDSSLQLAGRIRALREELANLDTAQLPEPVRCELVQLLELGRDLSMPWAVGIRCSTWNAWNT
jgi:hypothetical protein